MINSDLAHQLTQAVDMRFREMLDEARALGKLDALALSGKKNEKWMVFDVFWRLMRDWSSILDGITTITQDERSGWEWHLELNYPSTLGNVSPKNRFDIGYGPAVCSHNEIYFATHDTVVFQAKMIRSFKLLEAHESVRYDVDRIRAEGMRHGYVMVLWVIYPDYRRSRGYTWDDDVHMGQKVTELVAAFTAALPELEPVCPMWGAYRLTLVQNWDAKSDNCVFAQLFRVRLAAAVNV